MATRTVTGTFRTPRDEPWANFTVVFVLRPSTYTNDATYPERRVTATTDDDGQFSIELATGVAYEVSYPDLASARGSSTSFPKGSVFEIVVPEGVSPISLEQIQAVSSQPTTPSLLTVVDQRIATIASDVESLDTRLTTLDAGLATKADAAAVSTALASKASTAAVGAVTTRIDGSLKADGTLKETIVTRAALDASVGNAYIRTDRKWARSFLAALATVDTSPVDILVIGDSTTEGKTVSAIVNRYVTQLQRELRRAYQPSAIAGGDGYFAASPSTVSTALWPWVLAGAGGSRAAVNLGLGRRGFRVQNSANTATLTFTGTGFRLLFTGYASASDISVSIDGGGAIAIPSANPTTKPGMTWDSAVLTAGAHTAVFTIQPGSGFEGALIFNGDKDAGVRVWDGGHGGYAVADYISPNTGWQDSLTAVNADLVLINLALNDWGAFQTDPAAWKTRMKDLIAVIRTKCATTSPSIGIVIPYQRTSTSQVPVATWAAMVQAHYDLATEDGNLGVLDLDRYLGAMSGSGLMDGDGVHINDLGHRLFGQTLARLLIPSNA